MIEAPRIPDLTWFAGKRIDRAFFYEKLIALLFSDGSIIAITDSNDCCEKRYFASDDDIEDIEGCKFLEITVRSVKSEESGDVIEECFAEIRCSMTIFSFKAYNVHNGYYSGFNLNFYSGMPLKFSPVASE